MGLTASLVSDTVTQSTTPHRRPDLLISGGLVVDGTGRLPFRADLAVTNGVITALLDPPNDPADARGAHAAYLVDVTGLVVAPGFIDIHSHADFPARLPGRGNGSLPRGDDARWRQLRMVAIPPHGPRAAATGVVVHASRGRLDRARRRLVRTRPRRGPAGCQRRPAGRPRQPAPCGRPRAAARRLRRTAGARVRPGTASARRIARCSPRAIRA